MQPAPNNAQNSSEAAEPANLSVDVAIVGAGFVGLSLALILQRSGFSLVVIDRQRPDATLAASFDGRASAISAASRNLFTALDLWPAMLPHAAAINTIRVTDAGVGLSARGRVSPFFVHFSPRDAGDQPMGHIVENRALRSVLTQAGLDQGLEWISPHAVTSYTWPNPGSGRGAEIRLDDGRSLSARLVVAADGRGSATRQAAGIKLNRWDYDQIAMVATIGHERPHQGVAHENFLDTGPFALLPLPDQADTAGHACHRSSLVWAVATKVAPRLLQLDDSSFALELQKRFGSSLGALSISGQRWSYPLSLVQARAYTDTRLALIGDAAHAIHPLAGQGLNLGFRDAAALAEVLVDARNLGLDLGSAGVLETYARWRRVDAGLMIAATDGLNRLFSTPLPPLKLARRLGLSAVNALPGLKQRFVGEAMGLAGDLPRLLRGQPL